MSNKRDIYRCLEEVFKYKEFKSKVQKEAVNAVINGKQDVFVSMPTGAGKSLVYQLPAVISHGVTVVVSPLLALMQDQVEALKALGICVANYNSKILLNERLEIKSNLLMDRPSIKLLYCTPELLQTPEFNRILEKMNEKGNLAHFAVDEAHCVSQWGHDFRPAYVKLGSLRDKYSDIHWLALTATATPQVQQDTLQLLHFKQPVAIFKTSCYRENLFFEVRFKELLDCPHEDLVDYVNSVLKKDERNKPNVTEGCGIIYCHTKENCENMADKLSDSGIKTKAYHAGMNSKVRNDIQLEWMTGVIKVIAATVSFGMGVDKSSVRFVVHWKIPQSVERYYQESGRAGRDGKSSYCRLYYSKHEREQMLFLLRKDLQKKKKKDKKIEEKVSMKSFKALVAYCEEAKCRHAFISEYFGDEKPECNKGCDFCRNRKEVEVMIEQWRAGLFSNKSHNGYPKTYMCSDFGQVDTNLYGGGKRGADTKYSDDEGENDYEGKCKRYRNNLIQEEFKKRRGNGSKSIDKNDLENIPGLSCKIKEASNLTHIPKLSVKVREFCLGRLENALVSNCERNNRSKFRVERLAVNLEYDIFLANRSSQAYKLKTQQKVKEISQSTDRNELFSDANDNLKSLVQSNDESDIETKFKLNQFVKASELPVQNEINEDDDDDFSLNTFTRSSRKQIKQEKIYSEEDLGIKIKEESVEQEEASSIIKINKEHFEAEETPNIIKQIKEEKFEPEETWTIKNKEEKFEPEETSSIKIKEETFEPEETPRIKIKKEKFQSDETPTIKVEQIDLETIDMDCETESSASVITISSSTIQPLQGSPIGDKASVLQTLKRPSISKDVQKIIAKREKCPPKSEYDIPALPPLPPLTASFNKPTKPPPPLPSQEDKPEHIAQPPMSPLGLSTALQAQNKQPVFTSAQESFKSIPQMTSSNVQPTFSYAQSASSSGFQPRGPLPQTVSSVNSAPGTFSALPSGQPYINNSLNSNVMQPSTALGFTPVFTLGSSSRAGPPTTSFQGTLQENTSNNQFNYSSSIPSTYPSAVYPGLPAAQIAHAQTSSPQFTFPMNASYMQSVQPTQGISAAPMDPRLCHGIGEPINGPMITPSSAYFQHNYRLSVPMNVKSNITPVMHLPMSSQDGVPSFQAHANLTANTSKESVKTETTEKLKTHKKDCADIIVRYLTPYYKSGEVESKSLFKSLAKEMTERLVQNMGGVPEEKLRNTARALVKMYFDEKRRKSSKVK